jgi:hypothetical protein
MSITPTVSWTTSPDVIVKFAEQVAEVPLYAYLAEKQGRRGFTLTIPFARAIVEAFPMNGGRWEVSVWTVEPHGSAASTLISLETFRAIDPPASLTRVIGREDAGHVFGVYESEEEAAAHNVLHNVVDFAVEASFA